MELFWYFVIYSFFGFLLEVAFAHLTRARKRARKCFVLLPLCPVYGVGALAILFVSRWVHASGPALIVFGGLAATSAEYWMAVFYERVFGVAFWDYSGTRFHIRGRICPSFSLIWGVLAVLLVRRIHPAVALWAARIPLALLPSVVLVVVADGVCTAALLRTTRDIDSLRWYAK